MNEDRGFLRDILANPEDPVPRLVYADWLDERADPRGEFLRIELELRQAGDNDERRKQLQARLAELQQSIDPKWLALLDRTEVENCGVRFVFECPQRWEALDSTDDDRVRDCKACDQRVYHCTTLEEANDHARRRHCVAVDSRLCRTPGDLVSNPPRAPVRMGKIAAPVPVAPRGRGRPGDRGSSGPPPRRPPRRRGHRRREEGE